jgi:hypothetical protein
MILNLKNLNLDIVYEHFKMETLETAMSLITQGCWLASLDLSDAYYTVPILAEHTKFLKFVWEGIVYKFICMPNGLACAPRYFTKILKPVMANLRAKGHASVIYIDDTLLIGQTREECTSNVQETEDLLTKLGFFIHPTKSVKEPQQRLTFLGFVIDTVTMTVCLTEDKAQTLKFLCQKLRRKSRPTIRQVSQVIGKMVSSLPGVSYGKLYYRHLERQKIQALRDTCGNFDRKMSLHGLAFDELDWWSANITTCRAPIRIPDPNLTLETDASNLGWGANLNGVSTGGPWAPSESIDFINVLELKAAFLGLQAFLKDHSDIHVRLLLDNTTAVAYVNNMGGCKSEACDDIARQIIFWCKQRGIWVSANYLPGICNTIADRESRVFHDGTEWMLDPSVLQDIFLRLGKCDIDLFASRLNKQLERYVSWRPDPNACFTDAFSVSWKDANFYMFPPFSIIHRVLRKILEDGTGGILIIPHWPAQPWVPLLARVLLDRPLLLPRRPHLLSLPYKPQERHPLSSKLRILACPVSGNTGKVKAFQQRLLTSCLIHGEQGPSASTTPMSGSGCFFAMIGRSLPFQGL